MQPETDSERRTRELIIGLALSIGLGIVVGIIGFIGTVVYLLTSGHLHAADRAAASLYLVAPALGILVAAVGGALTIRRYRQGAPPGDDGAR